MLTQTDNKSTGVVGMVEPGPNLRAILFGRPGDISNPLQHQGLVPLGEHVAWLSLVREDYIWTKAFSTWIFVQLGL